MYNVYSSCGFQQGNNNSDVYVVVMGLVLGQSLMVISTTGITLYAKVSPLYNVLWEWIVVYKHVTQLYML